MRNKSFKHESTQVNADTGEIVTVSKTFYIPIKKDAFYFTFINGLSSIYSLKSIIDIKLIIKLCEIAEYNTGKVFLTKDRRKEIAYDLGISIQQITNSISSLKKNGLISGNRGTYDINSNLFWKGSLDTREQLVRGVNANKDLIEFSNNF